MASIEAFDHILRHSSVQLTLDDKALQALYDLAVRESALIDFPADCPEGDYTIDSSETLRRYARHIFETIANDPDFLSEKGRDEAFEYTAYRMGFGTALYEDIIDEESRAAYKRRN